jgi:hypothetical protein
MVAGTDPTVGRVELKPPTAGPTMEPLLHFLRRKKEEEQRKGGRKRKKNRRPRS